MEMARVNNGEPYLVLMGNHYWRMVIKIAIIMTMVHNGKLMDD